MPAGRMPDRTRALRELLIGYGLILLVLWTPRPWQRIFYLVAFAYLLVTLWRCFTTRRAFGMSRRGLLASSWVIVAASLLATAAAAIALHFGTLHPERTPLALFHRYWGYALWAFGQQILLQIFFLERLLRLLPGRRMAAFAAALIFALAHLPSPVLFPVTFVWGWVACLVFLRHHNLIPLAIAHAILGITVATTLPGSVTHNMRAGLGYLTYARHRMAPGPVPTH